MRGEEGERRGRGEERKGREEKKKTEKERKTGIKGCQVDACKHTACRLQCHSESLITSVPKKVK